MAQHKDQKRVQDALIPAIMDRCLDESPEAVRDCTVINRLLVQGPDPLFLMESCPDEFASLCAALSLDVETGRDAIESAHWTGPGCLLEGTGLPADLSDFTDLPEAWRKEALWLVLASMSDCTEEGYTQETMVRRIQRQAKAIGTLSRFAFSLDSSDLAVVMFRATGSAREFIKATKFTEDPRFGKPMTDRDEGFYVAYKLGHACAAVQAGSLTFYGTTPETTLEAEGVTVDKPLSPHFGICFGAAE